MESEIAEYLRKVTEGRLSAFSKKHIAHMLREVDELESVGDSMYHLARTLSRKRQHEPAPFTKEQIEHMEEMMNYTDQALTKM